MVICLGYFTEVALLVTFLLFLSLPCKEKEAKRKSPLNKIFLKSMAHLWPRNPSRTDVSVILLKNLFPVLTRGFLPVPFSVNVP